MPSLTILAGPNGAGKSRNTNFLLSENLLTALPVDLDFLVVQAYNDLSHSRMNKKDHKKGLSM